MQRIIRVDSHGSAVHRLSARTGDIFIARLVGQQRRGFRHPIAYQIRQFDSLEPFLYLWINRRSSKNELNNIAAESLFQAGANFLEYDIPYARNGA